MKSWYSEHEIPTPSRRGIGWYLGVFVALCEASEVLTPSHKATKESVGILYFGDFVALYEACDSSLYGSGRRGMMWLVRRLMDRRRLKRFHVR